MPATASLPDYGFAVIERFRNNTKYHVNIEKKKTIHDLLPVDTVIRIKSLKPEYGTEGRYYAVRKNHSGYSLKADTTDKDDPAAELIVHRYTSKDLQDWIGLSSLIANKQFLRAAKNQAVQLYAKTFANEGEIGAHWKISGGDLRRCFLQNRGSKGFLSTRGSRDKRDIMQEIFGL